MELPAVNKYVPRKHCIGLLEQTVRSESTVVFSDSHIHVYEMVNVMSTLRVQLQ